MTVEYFWAKTKTDGKPGKTVLSHMSDVRAVADFLLTGKESFLSKYQLSKDMLACFVGLHDIGKISPGFQSKCKEWLRQNNLESVARNNAWDTLESDHAKITQYTIQNILQKNKMANEVAELWSALLGAHHGRLNKLGVTPRGCKLDDEWEQKRETVVADFLGCVTLPDFTIDNSWPLTWWLAGLISIADWVGSNEDYFSPDKIETTLDESAEIAVTTFKSIGFDDFEIHQNLSFGDIFKDNSGRPFSPNDLQKKVGEHIVNPGLYVIEAPMGMGKTEAALWCAYKLMSEGKALGIYFALPTQSTSNRIHIRMQKFLERISMKSIEVKLVHANSWLLENTRIPSLRPVTAGEKESVQAAKDWFASKKRALLAPFGVGTIDQALMSIIAVKHFFVRQFALAGKVIILDEVHSYDLYTGTLIKTLCEKLLPLGCTILILSATLARKSKKLFIDIADKGSDKDYPCITGKEYDEGNPLFVPVEKPVEKNVKIFFKNQADTLAVAIEKAKKGASVLWVCDTVNCAQEMYQQAVLSESRVELGIVHARFPLFRRQELEEYWMMKFGKEGIGRSGCVLFSTQVVEQSVDLDADFMVSELAPTDMLLQRMGRLWRHNRAQRLCKRPELCIVAENNQFDEFKKATTDKIKKMFGAKARIYAPYILLRSLEVWKKVDLLKLPNDIRNLLKQTYKDRVDEPKGWQELFKEIAGNEFAQSMSAEFEANVWNPLLNDEEGSAKTRVNNYPMTQMILAQQKQGNTIILLNDEVAELGNDTVSLAAARSIHRNIVKIPAHCFSGQTENKDVSAVVRGDWQLGIVEDNGNIANRNLKNDYMLKYTPQKGVEIIRDKTKSEVDNEPCD